MFITHCVEIPSREARTARGICLFLALCCVIPCATPGHLTDLEVSEKAGLYRVRMGMLVRAPAKYVHDVLTDYLHIYRLNPAITESEILPSRAHGTVRVRTRVEGCLFFFCREFDRVEDVRQVQSGHLQAVIVPEYSDFSEGRADWYIQPLGEDSQVIYESQFTPAFFIPPIIGSYFVKRTLGEAVLSSFSRIECIARIRAGLALPSREYLTDASPQGAEVVAMQAALLAGKDPSVHDRDPSAGRHNWRDGTCLGVCEQGSGGC
jgi:hypothetical protein